LLLGPPHSDTNTDECETTRHRECRFASTY